MNRFRLWRAARQWRETYRAETERLRATPPSYLDGRYLTSKERAELSIQPGQPQRRTS